MEKTPEQALKQNEIKQLPQLMPKPSGSSSLLLKSDVEGKKAVIEILYQCFLSMELYGKQPKDFQIIKQMFLTFLKDWPSDKIVMAFERYVKTHSRFPTVSDILSILEERIKPNQAYYQALLHKRKTSFLSSKEEEYIAKYEKQALEDFA